MIDTDDVIAFMATHARLLDVRRARLALGAGDPDAALSALAAYRNPDGGYGWGIEPDLRAPSSQPVGALHAFEVFEDVAPAVSPLAAELCDWLAGVTLPDGALPFSLPGADRPGTAPWFAKGDPSVPSLHITAAVAGIAHRVARHDRAVAGHPWLAQATGYCMQAIPAVDGETHTLVLLYVLQFLDAVHDTDPRAREELGRLATLLPPSGTLPVAGGSEGEVIGPLQFSPHPDRPLRALIDPQAVDDDLDRLEAGQQPDGGWQVDFGSFSPAAALEWRGHATVRAIGTLIANGRLKP